MTIKASIMAEVEMYEGEGENSLSLNEDLFEELQSSLQKLVQVYTIDQTDLQALLNVISQLWEHLDENSSQLDKYDEQQKELERVWNEEKEKRRQAEKRRTELENRFDEERYQWHSERQEIQRDRVGLVTKIKQLEERNKELVNDLDTQSEKYEQDQQLRNDLMEQYKKQYEIAKTSTLKRKKNKKHTVDYSAGDEPPIGKRPTSPLQSPKEVDENQKTMIPSQDSQTEPSELLHDDSISSSADIGYAAGRYRRQLPSKNSISLKTELKHPKGQKMVNETPVDFNYQHDEDRYYEIETQEELLTSGPELLVVPTVAEVDMLKREQDESKQTIIELQRRLEEYREEKESLERHNAELLVDVDQYKLAVTEYLSEMTMLKQERNEILESYLDQPFDVYCVTKKELHEVLKKLHSTQIEMQKQSEEKQSLEQQLQAKRRKKNTWKSKLARKVRNMFHSRNHTNSNSSKNEEYEILSEPTMSYQIPPEAPFTPKSPSTIKAMDHFRVSHGWLISEDGPTPSTLPSFYCQLMLKEYHVTDAISCMSLARVYQTSQPLQSKRPSLLPLAARTAKGRLCAEVWIGSNEGPTSFIEVVDILSKRVVDRFLIRGNKVVCMESVPGTPMTRDKPRNSSTNSARKSSSDVNSKQFLEESLDLFAKDDQALQKMATQQQQQPPQEYNRTRHDSGKSESDLRQYYKSRFRGNSKSTDSEKRASLDMSRSGSVDITVEKSDNSNLTSKLKQSIKAASPRLSRRSPSSNPSSPAISRVSKTAGNISIPPPTNSLAAELLQEDPDNSLVTTGDSSSPQQKPAAFCTHSSSTSQDDASMEVFTDDEGEELHQTSTPMKVPVCDGENHDQQHFMWVAPDTSCIHLYDAVNIAHHPKKILKLPSQPSCIRHIPQKVCVGLCDSRMIIYHQETIVSDKACVWDVDNPTYIDLPKLIPENPLPVRDIRLIRGKIWVSTGSFLTLLDPNTLISQGSKFLDGSQPQPNKLLPLDDVVLVSTVKGCNIFLLDPNRAEVLKRINISPASLVLDNLLQLSSVNVTDMVNDEWNVYISTSVSKIFALPRSSFSIDGDDDNRFIKQVSMPDPNDIMSASYPPSAAAVDHPLFKCLASSLQTHREGSVRGLVHVPLPEEITISMKCNSSMNLSTRSFGVMSASSLPSLVSADSPPMMRSSIITGTSGNSSGLSHPVYKSLLVSCGKGYTDYLSDSSVFEGSTALREKNEAFQVIVWGYEQLEDNDSSHWQDKSSD